MGALPDPVVSALVRGLAAYMQHARRTDLPPALRSLQGKHLKMLQARRNDVVGALEDEAQRAMILDWLADKPSGISKADADILAIAAQRENGWAETLAGKMPHATPPKGVAKNDTAALDREKERARKAREDARKAKEEAAGEIAAQKAAANESRARVTEMTHVIAGLRQEMTGRERAAQAELAQMERDLRKARRRAEKAEAQLDGAKDEIRELRAQLSKAVPTGPPAGKKKAPTMPVMEQEPVRRKRLAVPKGRLADAPETLTDWLSVPHLHLLIDGYNVSKAEGGFGDLGLETQRQRLLQEVGKVARKHKVAATVIFDGSDIAPGTSRRARGPVQVEYSRPEEIADDHLIAKLEGLPKHPVVVVTNDKELQGRAARLGATIATSNQLLRLIR
jgi:predicted RNA-binding protein with PIN domain